ncbi:MAG TPA: DUF1080 domain-containing protein [Armatimonadota bacterium]|nr:DUF1080 domain-containing protein [Armatimonadota bacterium]
MNRRKLLTAGALLGVPALGLPDRVLAQPADDTDAPMIAAPSGAIVLFDGKDLSRWVSRKDNGPAGWKVENGYAEIAPGSGDIYTRDTFGDFQLHVEWWLPHMPDARGQARANSGVYLQGKYEIQVLDSYGLESKDNDAGGIYKVAAPLRNASKKPEKWQSYDIAFRAPRYDASGNLTEKVRVTVFHNGVMIHNNQEFDPQVTTSGLPGDFTKPGPILLQDHGNRVRYRNIWLLPVKG